MEILQKTSKKQAAENNSLPKPIFLVFGSILGVLARFWAPRGPPKSAEIAKMRLKNEAKQRRKNEASKKQLKMAPAPI